MISIFAAWLEQAFSDVFWVVEPFFILSYQLLVLGRRSGRKGSFWMINVHPGCEN